MTPGFALAEAATQALAFEAEDARVGNLVWGRGRLDGRAVRVARIENRIASGSIGRAEADRLVSLLRVVAAERAPLVLFLDSAGARVSEGLAALGAFRALYRAALDAALAGAPIACILGRNAYGGSSMLAMVASERLLSGETQLAMSGPAIIASTAGAAATDEAFQAMAQATTSPQAREKTSSANHVWLEGENVSSWLRRALEPRGDVAAGWHERHQALALRFDAKAAPVPTESLQRRDLARLYDGGYEAREGHGLVEGRGVRAGGESAILGVVGSAPLGLARAWRFAELAWGLRDSPPGRLDVLLDCATHAARLEDERAILSEFIVDMAFALAVLRVRGWQVTLTVLGKAGGGVYVALAAPAERVASVHGAEIHVLPIAAVAAILGEGREVVPSFADYRAAGVADEEIKLGLVPGSA
jgi:hypothetical protein